MENGTGNDFCTRLNESGTARVEVADVLRGVVIVGICLLHSTTHFNLHFMPVESNPWFLLTDRLVQDVVLTLFSGKAYEVFALLFGFSFGMQKLKADMCGINFTGRFIWRMVILLGLGCINALFFVGDILVLYAFVGLMLLPFRGLKTKYLLWIAGVFMLQPVILGKILYALVDKNFVCAPGLSTDYFQQVLQVLLGDSLTETWRMNIWIGQCAGLLWDWEKGRFFQTASLFLLGVVIVRKQLFLAKPGYRRFWKVVLFCGLLGILGGEYGKSICLELFEKSQTGHLWNNIWQSWINFGGTMAIVACVVLLYYKTGKRGMWKVLTACGKMSLTNYMTQSLIGSCLFYGWGLGLFRTCGFTYSFLIGCVIVVLQMFFSVWWLKYHQHGMVEGIWRKLTWMNFKRNTGKDEKESFCNYTRLQ